MNDNKNVKEVIDGITEKIKKEYDPIKVILFGSYAYGTPHEDSDIDFFIIKETTKERRERFVELKKLIYELQTTYIFSPLIYTPEEVQQRILLEDDFIKEILEKGKVLYAREN